MRQILIIHGGSSFSSYDGFLADLKRSSLDYERLKPTEGWKRWISDQLPESEVLLPSFPNSNNAQYSEWCIYFEKLLPFLRRDAVIIGHSLGAMFLTKYLHDHPLAPSVRQLLLVAGGYDDDSNEDLGSFKVTSAKGLEESAHEIHLFHSQDDPVVPFTELAKFQSDLPNAITHTFEDRGHFNDSTFAELLHILKQK